MKFITVIYSKTGQPFNVNINYIVGWMPYKDPSDASVASVIWLINDTITVTQSVEYITKEILKYT